MGAEGTGQQTGCIIISAKKNFGSRHAPDKTGVFIILNFLMKITS